MASAIDTIVELKCADHIQCLQVVIGSENMGQSSYAGPGAGRYPTANSVVSDLIRLAQGVASGPFPLSADDVQLNTNYTACFYVRVSCAAACSGILRWVVVIPRVIFFSACLPLYRIIGEAAEQNSVSVQSFTSSGGSGGPVDYVLQTGAVEHSRVQAFARAVSEAAGAIGGRAVVMPMLL